MEEVVVFIYFLFWLIKHYLSVVSGSGTGFCLPSHTGFILAALKCRSSESENVSLLDGLALSF